MTVKNKARPIGRAFDEKFNNLFRVETVNDTLKIGS